MRASLFANEQCRPAMVSMIHCSLHARKCSQLHSGLVTTNGERKMQRSARHSDGRFGASPILNILLTRKCGTHIYYRSREKVEKGSGQAKQELRNMKSGTQMATVFRPAITKSSILGM